MSKFFIPSNCSDNVIHFNFNLVRFALIRRALSGNSIIYATINKAIIKLIREYFGTKSRIWYNILQCLAN